MRVCIAVGWGTGHPNITLRHKSTLEFTSEDRLTPRGDCIACTSFDTTIFTKCIQLSQCPCRIARAVIAVVTVLGERGKAVLCGIPVLEGGVKTRAVARKTSSRVEGTVLVSATHSASDLKRIARSLSSSFAKCIVLYSVACVSGVEEGAGGKGSNTSTIIVKGHGSSNAESNEGK